MKIRFDENLAPALVDATRRWAVKRDCELTSVIVDGIRGESDRHWITEFASEGGVAIVSADLDFWKHEPVVAAVKATGIKVINLPPAFKKKNLRLQLAFILQWWPRIEEQIVNMRKGECYRPEWNISEEAKLIQIQLRRGNSVRKKKQTS